ncbi:MAG TPA: Smr/MutS family protein [Bacteroidales bacterium]|nr:Smr/MutS family protein [Bacteroidales bacterium]
MIYPDSFEIKIGFDKIRQMIKSGCMGDAAKNLVDEIKFSNNKDYLSNLLKETEEMISICMLKDNYPVSSYPDIRIIVNKLKVEGTSLEVFEIIDIRTVLESTKSIRNFFKTDENNKYPLLKSVIDKIIFPTYIYERIQTIISKNGTVKDSASPTLKEIRKNLDNSQSLVSKKLNTILGKIRDEGWVSKDLSATMVNGRLVLPIESAFKRKIAGLIHDESASGKTSYIEPQEVVELNNNIREYELAETREIKKILFELTEEFRPYCEELNLIRETIAYLDFIRAKSLLSIRIGAIIPQFDENPGLDIARGKHPLLYLSLKNEKKEVIPTSFKLDNNSRILLISGPNAGGKSVCLKATALLVYMFQCGLPIPVGGTTVMGIFDNIFLDIGDQQSIENDLSTYSSHLLNMKYFLKNANEKTLILIDEFGSGTDPIIGGLIAESILEELNDTKCYGVITTHYSNLKVFASNTEGIQNGAMLIDQNKMQPLYILETGIPGSSYAIEIANRIGLPQSVTDKTKEKIGNDQTNLDKFLRRVMRDKKYWETKRQQIRIQEKKLEEIIEKNIIELETLKARKKQILDEARKESQQLLTDVNKQIENTIRKIKESNADKELTKEARVEIQEFKESFNAQINDENDEISRKYNHFKKKQEEREARRKEKLENPPEIIKIDETKINLGSKVRLIGQEVVGEVTDLGEKNVVVSFGNIYTSVPYEKLEKVSEAEYKQKNRSASSLHFNYNEKVLNFKPYIDVRGDRVEEALRKITDLVDEAIMLDFKELKILHGKGNGILRQHIRDYLRTIPRIDACYDEDIRFGGGGITIVKFK